MKQYAAGEKVKVYCPGIGHIHITANGHGGFYYISVSESPKREATVIESDPNMILATLILENDVDTATANYNDEHNVWEVRILRNGANEVGTGPTVRKAFMNGMARLSETKVDLKALSQPHPFWARIKKLILG